jgi:hypothetical protein
MCVPRKFPNSLHIQCKYLVAMATDSDTLLPLSPRPFHLVVPVGGSLSIGRGENQESFHPSFRCVLFPLLPTGTWMFCCLLDPRLTKMMGRAIIGPLSSGGVAVRLLGLDGIDHLGLGGTLRRTGTVFRYGIHTWHHCRYVITTLYFTLPVFVSSILSF